MKYKTIFVDAPTIKKKGAFGMGIEEVNGDQLTRDVNAAVQEMTSQGYELLESMPISSPKLLASAYVSSYTAGILLIFKKTDS